MCASLSADNHLSNDFVEFMSGFGLACHWSKRDSTRLPIDAVKVHDRSNVPELFPKHHRRLRVDLRLWMSRRTGNRPRSVRCYRVKGLQARSSARTTLAKELRTVRCLIKVFIVMVYESYNEEERASESEYRYVSRGRNAVDEQLQPLFRQVRNQPNGRSEPD